MITVSRCASSTQLLAGYLVSSRNLSAGTVPDYIWRFGEIILIVPLSGRTLPIVSRTFRNERMYEGTMEWGKLRDKDVNHAAISGSVFVTALAASSVPPTQTSSSFYAGSNMVMGPTVRHVRALVHWGQDNVEVSTFVLPVRMAKNGDSTVWVEPYTRNVSVTHHFFEGVCYQYESEAGYTIPLTNKLTGKASQIFVEPIAFLTEFHLNPSGQSPGVYAGREYTVRPKLVDPYIIMDGKKKAVNELLVGSLPQKPTTMLTLMGKVTLPSQSGITVETVFEVVCKDLSSDALLEYGQKVLSLYPAVEGWGDLGSDILKQQVYVDSNILLTLFDLTHVLTDIDSWRNLGRFTKGWIKNMKGIPASLRSVKAYVKPLFKAYAGGFLGSEYGVLPTTRDVVLTAGGIKRLLSYLATPTRQHARRTFVRADSPFCPVTITRTLTCEVPRIPNGMIGNSNLPANMQGIEYLHKWGLWPDVEMFWDFLPLSFIADWAVNIGSMADRADMYLWKQYFPVEYVIMGEKMSWNPPVSWIWPKMGVTGNLTCKRYIRSLTRELPLPPIQMDEAGPFSHWAEAGALIVSRRG